MPHTLPHSTSTKTAMLLVVLLASASTGLWSQDTPLTVTSATPQGEAGVMADANEIRIAFSEPMVPLGAPPAATPSWLSITPAIKVNTYWSGTRTLIVTPDPDAPLPFGTRYRVRIDDSIRSVTNRGLAQAFEFEFTTPTVRLMSLDWYRAENRVDRPVFLRLRFNQPIDPAAVLAHAEAAYQPHDWTPPSLTPEERTRWQREDAANLARFDAKVAAARQAAALRTPVPITLAASWDEERFPAPSADATEVTEVIVQTLTPPDAGTSLAVRLDDRLVGREGSVPHATQSSSVQLEPVFLVSGVRCHVACDPTYDYSIDLTRELTAEESRARLSIADVTDPAVPIALVPKGAQTENSFPWGSRSVQPQRLGFARQPPATTWKLVLDDTTQSVDGQTLGYRWSATVSLANERPLAQWLGEVWEAGGGTAVPFVTRNVASATEYLAPMSPADIMPTLLALQQRNPVRRPPVRGQPLTLPATQNAVLASDIDVSTSLRQRPTGLVWASIDGITPLAGSPDSRSQLQLPRNVLLQVTNLGLTVKDSPQSTLILVTTLDTAQAVSGATVTIRDRSNTPVWSGTTNADGIALSPALPLRVTTTNNNPFSLSYIVTAEKDDDVAWVASDWTGDVYPGRFGLPYQLSEALPVLRGSVFTDRGAYLPGDQVAMKAILRFDTPTDMELFEDATLFEVSVRNPRGVEVSSERIPVNRWSSLEFDWQIPQDATLGNYVLSIGYPRPAGTRPDTRRPSVSTTFLVAAFRRPDFRVDATLETTTPILGDDLDGDIEANFLFGAPIGAQPVRWSVWRETTRHTPQAIVERYPADQFVFGYLKTPTPNIPRRVRLSEETTALSDDSTLHVTIPTERGDDSAATFQLEGDVTGVSGQHIANRTSLVVHPASLYVGVTRPPFFADVTRGVRTEVVAADLDGTARAGVDVTVALIRETWQFTPRPNAPWQGDWIRTETPAGEWKVTTTTGRVPVTMTLRDGGRYILRATAVDEENRPTRTEAVFYAFGGGPTSWKSDGNRIELTPERQTWSPGETARILVQSPWESATALVSTEREGIRSQRRVEITSTQDMISVPISEADIPNLYVSVLLLKGRTLGEPDAAGDDPGRPAFRLGYTELMVDNASKRLSVSVRADRDEYEPGEQVQVAVEVLDAARQPRSSEVTLWAMDYGLLSLTDYTVPDVARAIYARKSLQVQTQDSRSRLISRVATVGQQGGQGIAGGRGGRSMGLGSMSEEVAVSAAARVVSAPPPPPVDPWTVTEMTLGVGTGQAADQDIAPRTDFRPLAFWVGSLTTDADGRATTTVTLPDSLTTYRIMAVAGDVSSQFGAGDSEIQTTQPLTLLPAFPRFLSVGNRASFGAVVTNNSPTGGDATVTILNMEASALTFEGETTQVIRLAPGQSEPVRFDARALEPGAARVRVTVRLGEETDGFEVPLRVLSPARLETVAAYGDTISQASERLNLPSGPNGIVPTAGGLTISLASTALVGLGESARYLDDYPYQCAEPLASKALALLLSSDLDGAFGVAGADAAAQRAEGLQALADLATFQCPRDGGFSMFRSRCVSSPYLTAYILHVLRVAGALQAPSDQNAINSALNYLRRELRKPAPEAQWWPGWAATQAYSLKVLTEYGQGQTEQLDQLYALRERLPVFALSYLADALVASGDRGPRYAEVIRRMTNALRVDADRAHVEEVDDPSLVWLWNSNVRATAVVLEGLARRRDSGLLAAPMARWLLAERRNGRWQTTQENGVALNALVAYYRTFEAEVPQMTVTTTLGERVVGTTPFQGRTTVARDIEVAMADILSQPAANVTIGRVGTGRVYYTTRLQYLPTTPPPPVDRGLRFERTYERVLPDGSSESTTTFSNGDLVRVTVQVVLPHEGRFLAVTDPVPAGLEPIDGALKTTASDLGAQATRQSSNNTLYGWWRQGGFDHIEKHDDRVVAFATRLGAGRHEISYLARATTSGTFETQGTWGEALYAPEVTGRAAPTTVTVR